LLSWVLALVDILFSSAGKKEIKASLRRKIEQKLGIEGSLDALENKTKDLFKGFRFFQAPFLP
jgi:hypothetical protein